jgi:hypothetical protein
VNDDPYREFEEALTDVLTETAYSLRRRNPIGERTRSRRPARPSLYIEAVNRAFLMVLNQGLRQMGLTKAPLVQRPSTGSRSRIGARRTWRIEKSGRNRSTSCSLPNCGFLGGE